MHNNPMQHTPHPTPHLHTFRKSEHICLRSDVETLFSAGSASMSAYPVRATFRKLPYDGHGPQVKVLLSVAKRHLRHAVDRNLAKRQLREAYRQEKERILSQLAPADCVHIAFIWLADKPMPSRLVRTRVASLLQRIGEKAQGMTAG